MTGKAIWVTQLANIYLSRRHWVLVGSSVECRQDPDNRQVILHLSESQEASQLQSLLIDGVPVMLAIGEDAELTQFDTEGQPYRMEAVHSGSCIGLPGRGDGDARRPETP